MARMTKEEQERKKDYAKLLYTKENITNQTELALKVEVSVKTVGKWIEDGNWRKLKQNIVLTRQEQYANLMEELEKLNEYVKELPTGFADSKLADTRRKLIKDIKDLEGEKIGLSETIGVQVSFLEFIRKRNHTDAVMIAHYSDMFIKSKL